MLLFLWLVNEFSNAGGDQQDPENFLNPFRFQLLGKP